MSGTPNLETVGELAGSAYINLQNLAKGDPSIAGHPFYRITKRQLADALKELGVEPIEMEMLR